MAVIPVTRSDMRRLGRGLRTQPRLVPVRAAAPRHDDGQARRIEVVIPYTVEAWSKNRAWRHRRDGRTYLSTAARRARELLAARLVLECRAADCPIPWPARKTWLRLMVYRPDMRSDPLNVLDGFADGVAAGLGVNDRYFAVALLDWDVDEQRPRIQITVTQEAR